MGPVSSRDVIDLETSLHSAHAEIFVKLLVELPQTLEQEMGLKPLML